MVLNGAECYCLVPEKIFVFKSEKFIDPYQAVKACCNFCSSLVSNVSNEWTDDTWYNVKILAKNEASYTVTYIDYGNSEDVLEGDIVGDVGEIPDTDYIDQFVKIKDPMETLIINNRPVTLKRGQHAVTILCIWLNENQNLVEDILHNQCTCARKSPV